MRFYKTIGGRIMAWFLILSLVPLIGVSIAFYLVTASNATKATNSYLLEMTKISAAAMDEWLQGRAKKLQDYAKNPALLSGDPAQIQAFCKMATENTVDTEMILFADTAGNAITPVGQRVNVSDRDYFKAVMSGKEVAFSNLLVSKATGNKVIVIAVPVKGPTGLVGVLAGTFEPKTLWAKIANLKYGQNGYAYMIDSTGLVMAHPDESKVMKEDFTKTNSESLNRLAEKMLKGEPGTGRYTYEGVEKLVAYAPVKSTGWVVALNAPTKEVYAQTRGIAGIMILVIAVVAVVVVIMAIIVGRQISRPLVKLIEQADQMSTGDLRLDIATGAFGELGVLGEALKKMLGNTVGVLQSIGGAISNLEVAIKEIAGAADETARASEQVAQTVSQVATGAQNMAQDVSNISRNTEETVRRTEEGEKIMQDLARVISVLAKKSQSIGKAMERLTEHARQISGITDVITGIAAQTNLLALNAAIEAARAGDAGRGFAVVAEEVRKLAEESRRQAEEIAKLVESVTGDVEASASMIREAISLMEEEAQMGEKALTHFLEIARGAREVAELLNNVAAASEENAASAQQIAASAEEMSSAAQTISTHVKNLLTLMEALKEQAARFKI